MAKNEALEIRWATFAADIRLSTQSSPCRVLMSSSATRLYLGYIQGMPFLIVEDKALPYPATVPWSNVSAVGWTKPPTIALGAEAPK